MIKFAYNNTKNISNGYTPFKLNCGYHFCIVYKKNINPYSKSKMADNLVYDLKEFMTIYWENF